MRPIRLVHRTSWARPLWITLLLLLAGCATYPMGLSRAEWEAYSEHKTSQYLVRISRGPGEFHAVGSYAIRVYGTNGLDLVAGTIRPRDGELVQSWVLDDNGEARDIMIFVWTRVAGTGAYGTLELMEFNGKTFRPTKLAAAEASLLDGHRGHDTFDVRNGMIYWQFPLYRPEDSNSNPTGGTRCLELAVGKKKWRLSNHRIDGDK